MKPLDPDIRQQLERFAADPERCMPHEKATLTAAFAADDLLAAREHGRAEAAAAAEAKLERMEDALRDIAGWATAYPLRAFPEPDEAYYAKARAVLEANGMTLDLLSAAAMRHVITQVGKIARMGLDDPP